MALMKNNPLMKDWQTPSPFPSSYSTSEGMLQHLYQQMREQHAAIQDLTHEMISLKGFYGWLMHAYPETIIQYKAIQELQRAAEGERVASSKEEAQAKMATYGESSI